MGTIPQGKTAWKLSYTNSKAAYCATCSLLMCTSGKKLEQFALKLRMELLKKAQRSNRHLACIAKHICTQQPMHKVETFPKDINVGFACSSGLPLQRLH